MSKIDHGLNLQWLTAGLIWFATWNGIILIVNLCYLSSLARQHSLQTLTLRYFQHETGNDDCTKNFPYWTLYLSYTSATDRMFTPNFLSASSDTTPRKACKLSATFCDGMHLKLYLHFGVPIIQNVKRIKVAWFLLVYTITELWINAINITC